MDAARSRSYLVGLSISEAFMRIPIGLNLAKTASFAVVHFGVAFSIAYVLTGSVGVASALALIEPLANTLAYFFHERAWSRVAWTAALPPSTRVASNAK